MRRRGNNPPCRLAFYGLGACFRPCSWHDHAHCAALHQPFHPACLLPPPAAAPTHPPTVWQTLHRLESVKQLHIILLAVSLVLFVLFVIALYRPYIHLLRRDTRAVVTMLSSLPAEVDVEGHVRAIVLGATKAAAPDATGNRSAAMMMMVPFEGGGAGGGKGPGGDAGQMMVTAYGAGGAAGSGGMMMMGPAGMQQPGRRGVSMWGNPRVSGGGGGGSWFGASARGGDAGGGAYGYYGGGAGQFHNIA